MLIQTTIHSASRNSASKIKLSTTRLALILGLVVLHFITIIALIITSSPSPIMRTN
jgi:hypothetical protein